VLTNFANGFTDSFTPAGGEFNGSLFESPPFLILSLFSAGKKWSVVNIVIAID
jgi:hypothetical protein